VQCVQYLAVFWIRIRRNRTVCFWPPGSVIICTLCLQKSKKTLISSFYYLLTSFWLFILEDWCKCTVPSKSNKQKITKEKSRIRIWGRIRKSVIQIRIRINFYVTFWNCYVWEGTVMFTLWNSYVIELKRSVLRIHDILVWIRIRGSADPCVWLVDPDLDPAIFVINLQDANKNLI
jgi:hypothetical protein